MLSQTRRLPLFVAAAAFVLYASTMGSGLNLGAIPLASKLLGWDAVPMVGQTILWLLMLPLQILPMGWVPLGLKIIAAILASAILGVLTRTVQLLPWDHPWDGVGRMVSAIPLCAGLAMCGLEFSYWQEATSTCGDLLDLLLLAAALWLLLEYKIRGTPRWLDAAVIIWGAGMAENWLMLLTLPVFVTGIISIERLRFFRGKFILRLAGWGLAGFSIYILMPMVNGLTPHSAWTFSQAWSATILQTFAALTLPYKFCSAHKLLAMGLAISYLVPTIPLIVRLRDEGTRNKSGADIFQIWLYRALRLGLLLVCCWLAFDPTPGVRQMIEKEIGIRLSMLTFDYLNALGAAFLIGNLLLISHAVVSDPYQSRRSRNQFPWRQVAGTTVVVGISVVVAGLIVRNGPAVVHGNFHPLEMFGDVAVKSLPPGPGVVLGDYPDRLRMLDLALHRAGLKGWQAVDTRELASVSYRATLDQHQHIGWLTDKTRHELTPLETLQLLQEMSRSMRICYLPPSYGHFFEAFYAEPTGAFYELKPRGKDPLDVPALSAQQIETNERFWTALWDRELSSVVPHRTSHFALAMTRWGLVPPVRDQDRILAGWFSIPLDAWAVALQMQGRLRDAQARLEESLNLNSNNISAHITLACNTNLQAGVKLSIQDLNRVAAQLGNPDRVTNILSNCGPFDEPTMNFIAGSLFNNHGLLIEAAEQFERSRELALGSPAPEVALAEIYKQLQMPQRSRSLIQHVRSEIHGSVTNSAADLDLALLESDSWLMQSNVASAENVLQQLAAQHPDDPVVAGRVLSSYMAMNDFTNALNFIDQQLAKFPDDVSALNNKAMVLMQSGRAAEALPVLDHVLMLTNQPGARVNRAFAQIALQNYALARADLRQVQKQNAAPAMVNFGLALVAEHDADTNAARQYLHVCLTNAAPGSQLWQQASARLSALEGARGKSP